MVEVARSTSTTMPTGAAAASAGVKATWTRTLVTLVRMAYCYRHPDRETGLSCSVCERPICTDCATFAAVGIRCPEHSGAPQGVARVTQGVRRASYEGTGLVTKVLVALNVLVFLAMLAQGASLGDTASGLGSIYRDGSLFIERQDLDGSFVGLAHGQWWRLLTAAFLHANLLHLGMNMLALWWFGRPVELVLGSGRFLLLYVVSGLSGSAGALLVSPQDITVGASGAIFGILGAALVLERQRIYVLGGGALGIIVLNLAFTFVGGSFGNISIGGHIGGLAGGALGALALSRFGRGLAFYGRLGALGIAGLVAVGALSFALAYIQVGRYT
jgi:membrane associated rhomboid family serine protease